MSYNPLYRATDYFQAFPEPEAVFANDISVHSRYLLPLASVSLSHISQCWSGKLHFIQPIEPYDGVVGEGTSDHHTYLCRPNWVGFYLNDDNRYEFAADWSYFLASNPSKGQADLLSKHYCKARESYARKRAQFKEYGALYTSYAELHDGKFDDEDRLVLVCELGGVPGWGNWADMGLFPLAEQLYIDKDGQEATTPLPRAEDGTPFSFVGWLHSFCYVDTSSCALYLFYHPVHRIALQTFDWS